MIRKIEQHQIGFLDVASKILETHIPPVEQRSSPRFDLSLQQHNAGTLAYFVESAIIGVLSFSPMQFMGSKKYYAHDIAILPEYRRLGYGSALLEEYLNHIKRDPWLYGEKSGFFTLIADINKSSQGIHERLGFSRIPGFYSGIPNGVFPYMCE